MHTLRLFVKKMSNISRKFDQGDARLQPVHHVHLTWYAETKQQFRQPTAQGVQHLETVQLPDPVSLQVLLTQIQPICPDVMLPETMMLTLIQMRILI